MPTVLAVTGTARVKSEWRDTHDLSEVIDTAQINAPLAFANGTGPGQANAHWQGERSVAVGATDNVPLHQMPATVYGGQGNVAFGSVRMIYVHNRSTTHDLTVTWSPAIASLVRAGGVAIITSPAGWAVSAPASLSVASSGTGTGSIAYNLLVVGVMA